MTTNQLLNLDFSSQDNRKKLFKALRLIPPLAKIPEDEIEPYHLEKALHIMCNKYNMFVHIQQDPVSGDGYDIWSCQIYSTRTLNELGKIYGTTLFEVFVKVNIAVYSEVRKQKKKGVNKKS